MDFAHHWEFAENEIGPFLLPDGTTRAAFNALRAAFKAADAAVGVAEGAIITARGDRDRAEVDLLAVALIFAPTVRALLNRSYPVVVYLPRAPSGNPAPAKILAYTQELAQVWERVNALHPPDFPTITLPLVVMNPQTGNITVGIADFVALRAAYEGFVNDVTDKETDLRLAQARRKELMARLEAVCVSYRAIVLGKFLKGSSILHVLPRINPPRKKKAAQTNRDKSAPETV